MVARKGKQARGKANWAVKLSPMLADVVRCFLPWLAVSRRPLQPVCCSTIAAGCSSLPPEAAEARQQVPAPAPLARAMAEKKPVKLISAEGFEFVVDYDAACVSNTIKNMLSSQGALPRCPPTCPAGV